MPSPDASPPPRLIASLARLGRDYPLERKLLVAPTFGAGRELLRRLALDGDGWVGFEVTTVRPLALRVARGALEGQGLRTLDPFDRQALADEALDGALARGFSPARLRELAEGVGFRDAVHQAVEALRLAGVPPEAVARSGMRDRDKRRFLARVLERYEALLSERRRADTATVLRAARSVLEDDPAAVRRHLGGTVVALMPGVGTRGLAGAVVAALRRLGAGVLETDPVHGLEAPDSMLWSAGGEGSSLSWLHVREEAGGEGVGGMGGSMAGSGGAGGAGESMAGSAGPGGAGGAGESMAASAGPGGAGESMAASAPVSIDLFHAASVTDELREVLRRVTERGLPWDQVEIVTPDPMAYGSALHALAGRLGVPVTYAVGLPVERTRPGRVARAYLDWIAEGFQAAPIRRLLEAGDLRPHPSKGRHAPAALARRFRSLRIGWGRLRYRRQIRGALAAADGLRPGRHESEDQFQRRLARSRDELHALRNVLFPALKATPHVPDRLGEGGKPVSPAELATGLRAFLRRVPGGDGADRAARERILQVLERVEATLRRRTGFSAALAILRSHLDIRVRAPGLRAAGPDDLGAPWRSEGGHLHLADLEHGGYTGRPAVFLVGIDADRVPGGGSQDPVLLDRDRRVLRGDLPTSTDLLRERTFRLAALLARLRGTLTLSYASWSAADGRLIQPSPLLLQALRLAEGDPALSFEDLHARLGPAACPLPRGGAPALDADDVWLAALDRDGVLADGEAAVRASFPGLDRGLAAREARRDGRAGPHHGLVEPRPDQLDPRRNPEVVLSASRLENLGACPLRYLYQTVLRVRPPDDRELDPDRWLDPLDRGSLLHDVFEHTLRLAGERGVKPHDPALEEVALEVLRSRLARARAEIPSPGEGVTRRESTGLEEDVRSFVRMVRETGAPWVKLELAFGLAGEEPLALEIEGGEVRLRGAVDRVDEDLAGLHVVDYKTGRPRRFQSEHGTFDGGRRLQHAVYLHAVDRLLPGEVVSAAYHHPTRRGENTVFPFPRDAFAEAPRLLGLLLDGVAEGRFVPTDDPSDCAWCDWAEVCRARRDDWGRADSPLAEWSAEGMNAGMDAHAWLRAARRFEKEG